VRARSARARRLRSGAKVKQDALQPGRWSASTGSTLRSGGIPSQAPMRADASPTKLDRGGRLPRPGRTSLLTRVFLGNVVVLVGAVLALAISPVTVSAPLHLREAVVLVAGLSALLVVNLILFRRAFAPLVRLTGLMQTIDLLEPGRRVPVYGDDSEVAELTQAFNQMLDRLEEERRQSAHRSLRAQEDERRRVAQELHDEIGQRLTALVLELDMLGRADPNDVGKRLIEAREAARTSLEEVRHIAQRLRPEALDELGLRNALAALAGRLSEQGGLRIVHRLEGRLPALTPDAELVIYRIAQESLTNVLRHAGDAEAVLTLRGDAEGVTLQVSDNGRGPDSLRPGAGIQGMRERALLVGGALRIRARPEGGTEVRLEVPAETE
jgi:two-component system, NarL family, sensor histidine kinase UhpB